MYRYCYVNIAFTYKTKQTFPVYEFCLFSSTNMAARIAAIEKWTAVGDICRCLHNFNGVLQICAAFTNAAVYRLKKTWDKVPKNVSKYISKVFS